MLNVESNEGIIDNNEIFYQDYKVIREYNARFSRYELIRNIITEHMELERMDNLGNRDFGNNLKGDEPDDRQSK